VLGLLGIVINVLGDPLLMKNPLLPQGLFAFGPKIAPALSQSHWFAVVMFALLSYSLFHFARKKLD